MSAVCGRAFSYFDGEEEKAAGFGGRFEAALLALTADQQCCQNKCICGAHVMNEGKCTLFCEIRLKPLNIS